MLDRETSFISESSVKAAFTLGSRALASAGHRQKNIVLYHLVPENKVETLYAGRGIAVPEFWFEYLEKRFFTLVPAKCTRTLCSGTKCEHSIA